MRLWSVPDTAVVLLTPIRTDNDVWAWLHVLYIDSGIGRKFTQWTYGFPLFVGSYSDIVAWSL